MRIFLSGIAIAVSLFITVIADSVYIFSAENPYLLTAFIKCTDYDRKGHNEYHPDDIILQKNGSYSLGNVEGIFDGAWLKYDTYFFGDKGTEKIRITYCVNSQRCAPDSRIEVWINGYTNQTGTQVATFSLPATGVSWDKYITMEKQLDKKITGNQTVFFVLRGTTSVNTPFVANLGSFSFVDPAPPTPSPVITTQPPTPTPTRTPTPTPVKTTPPATTETVTEQVTTLPPEPTETVTVTETIIHSDTPEITDMGNAHSSGKWNIIVYASAVTGGAVPIGALIFYIIKKKNK